MTVRRVFLLPEKAGPDATVTMPNARHFTCVGSAREFYEGERPVSTNEMNTERAIAAEEVIENVAARSGLTMFGWPLDLAPRELRDVFGTQAKNAGAGDPVNLDKPKPANRYAIKTIFVLRNDVPFIEAVYHGEHGGVPTSYREKIGRWTIFGLYGPHR